MARRRRRHRRSTPRTVASRRNCRKAFRVKCGGKVFQCRIKRRGRLVCKSVKAKRSRRRGRR